jgi:hypothetical protein
VIHDVMIALMTVGAPSFPDEHYAMIPFVICDHLGTRLLCEATLAGSGVDIIHDA